MDLAAPLGQAPPARRDSLAQALRLTIPPGARRSLGRRPVGTAGLGTLLSVSARQPARTRREATSRPVRGRDARRGRRMFAMTIPGLAILLSGELGDENGLTVADSGFDGRADVVLFEAGRGKHGAAVDLELAEDVFVEVGRTLRSHGDNPRGIAQRIWRPERVEQALSVWAELVAPLRAGMTFRVIARLLHERSFLRTELRRQFVTVIERDRSKWRVEDPAQLEVWVTEYRPGRFVAGFRLSDVRMRQRGGREVERPGALRPVLAAAMVRLAGEPGGRLLDPCCGSGTVLREARRHGWEAMGSDIDLGAVEIARVNTGDVDVRVADARRLDLDDASVHAVGSNLPFGRRYGVEGSMEGWLRQVLAEMARVTVAGGRVVLLAPDIPRDVVASALLLKERHKLQLLGAKASLWVFDRMPDA